MSAEKTYPVTQEAKSRAHIDDASYLKMYQLSLSDPESFWGEQAEKFVTWNKRWTRVMDCDYQRVNIQWFDGAQLNVSFNCLDRHLDKRGDQTAIIWEGDDPNVHKHITYRQLYEKVCRFANVLKSRGVKRGDRVSIYLPMIPETAVAMLACARI